MYTQHLNRQDIGQKQQGAVLALALIFLLLLTIIGISAMSTATLEEKMAGNTKDRNLALQAAESALRDGERHAQIAVTPSTTFNANCAGGLCMPALATASTVDTPVWKDTTKVNWQTGLNTFTFGDASGETALTGLGTQPRYIIEDIPDPTSGTGSGDRPGDSLSCKWEPKGCAPNLTNFYRITAWGKGRTGAEVILQSIFEK